ncbi:hypothetical protein FHR84_003257 [Actinopolyspora biskrensis]|uniref:DUF3039 domain-containing protein n=1 Tax=Actinopolyspora biskrensis TaxID=1470178 RepID=A0A852Z0A5_9ACTN|nr:hypothetical protein [Actinopolyspora biskrensis]NYH79908.1 hypothetical protein [Actinopolyspora biskrensis]
MTVLLARQRADLARGGEPPAVHAYRLPDNADTPDTLTAACGHELKPGEGEQMSASTGAPCTPCLLAVATQVPATASRQPDVPTVAVDPAGGYAAGLRGEQVCHFVPDHRITGQLDGRSVVQTVCGCLAWGPLHTPPEEWPVCEECTGIKQP